MLSLVFLSRKGGTGKSTLAYHMTATVVHAVEHRALGWRVLALDFDEMGRFWQWICGNRLPSYRLDESLGASWGVEVHRAVERVEEALDALWVGPRWLQQSFRKTPNEASKVVDGFLSVMRSYGVVVMDTAGVWDVVLMGLIGRFRELSDPCVYIIPFDCSPVSIDVVVATVGVALDNLPRLGMVFIWPNLYGHGRSYREAVRMLGEVLQKKFRGWAYVGQLDGRGGTPQAAPNVMVASEELWVPRSVRFVEAGAQRRTVQDWGKLDVIERCRRALVLALTQLQRLQGGSHA